MFHSLVISVIVIDPNTPQNKTKLLFLKHRWMPGTVFTVASLNFYFLDCSCQFSVSFIPWFISMDCFWSVRVLHASVFDPFIFLCYMFFLDTFDCHKWLSVAQSSAQITILSTKTQVVNSYGNLYLCVRHKYQHYHLQN